MPGQPTNAPRHHRWTSKSKAKAATHRAEAMEPRVLLSGNVLVFTIQPASAVIGDYVGYAPGVGLANVQVTIEGPDGQPSENGDLIELSLGANPSGAFLEGNNNEASSFGVATFSNLVISKPGMGYTLVATDLSSSTPDATSQSFNVGSFNGLSDFNGTPGHNPFGRVIADSNGDLFGTTSQGGTFGDGTIFELSGTNHSTYSILISFTGQGLNYPGADPQAGLTLDANGNLYGTTDSGGPYNDGTVFELAANHTTFTSMVSFTGTAGNYPGALPQADLSIDSSGNLFGTTTVGGTYNVGTVFEIQANHTTFDSLVSFTGSYSPDPGSDPQTGVAVDKNGNLFGTANGASPYNAGTIFELLADHTTYKSLVVFTGDGGSDPGAVPSSDLDIDSNGNLFGTTEYGGSAGYGTIFELSSNLTTFSSLISFTGTSGNDPGAGPLGSLAMDLNGNLFGTTTGGSAFELAANHSSFSWLFNFTPNGVYPGSAPYGGLTLDNDGNLYGTTEMGDIGDGSVFEISGLAINQKLVFTTEPDNSGGGYPINAAGGLQVAIVNSAGVPIANSNDQITLSLSDGQPADGQHTVASVNGVATFNYATVNSAVSGCILVATDISNPSLPAVSLPFTVGYGYAQVNASNPLVLQASSSGPSLLVIGQISISGAAGAWTGKVDITNNDVDITNGSLATANNQVQQGYASGTWQGNGITSSTAASNTTNLTAVGIIQNNQSGTALYTANNPFDSTTPGPGDILVKYTYYGDTNLDGKIDGSDYSRIDNGSLNHLTGWFNGDFNYDGIINGSDYTLIDNAYNMQGASLAAQIAPAADFVKTNRAAARSASVFSPPQASTLADNSLNGWVNQPNNIAAGIFAVDEENPLNGKEKKHLA